jgi:2-iminobutanoate/2-iminopropanoate deaminase
MSSRDFIVVPGLGNPQWYSGAARYGSLIWSAGQVPTREDGSTPEDFSDQVATTLDNLERTLEAAGGGLDTLLKVNAYLASMDDFDAYNAVYTARIGAHGLPPRTTVEIARFRPPMRIEIDAVAHARAAE